MKRRSISCALFGLRDETRLSIKKATHLSFASETAIDADRLQQAVDKALLACPYMGYDIAVEDGLCYYCENDAPLPVHERTPEILGGEDNGSHLVYVQASGKSADIYISHALTDGQGMFWFLDALLKHYCACGEEVLYNGRGKPDYFTDLLEKPLPVSDAYTFTDYSPAASFRIPEAGDLMDMGSIRNAADVNYTVIDYIIDRDEYDDFCRRYHASHGIALFYFLARAVMLVHPGAAPAACRMPVNARRFFGVENAFQNASLNQVILSASGLTGQEGRELQEIAQLKARMKAQLSVDHLAYCLNQYGTYLRKAADLPQAAAGNPGQDTDHFGDIMGGMDQSFFISDLGPILSEKIAGQIQSVRVWGYTGVPVGVYLITFGSRILCEVSQVFESPVYLEATELVMKQYGITIQRIQL